MRVKRTVGLAAAAGLLGGLSLVQPVEAAPTVLIQCQADGTVSAKPPLDDGPQPVSLGFKGPQALTDCGSGAPGEGLLGGLTGPVTKISGNLGSKGTPMGFPGTPPLFGPDTNVSGISCVTANSAYPASGTLGLTFTTVNPGSTTGKPYGTSAYVRTGGGNFIDTVQANGIVTKGLAIGATFASEVIQQPYPHAKKTIPLPPGVTLMNAATSPFGMPTLMGAPGDFAIQHDLGGGPFSQDTNAAVTGKGIPPGTTILFTGPSPGDSYAAVLSQDILPAYNLTNQAVTVTPVNPSFGSPQASSLAAGIDCQTGTSTISTLYFTTTGASLSGTVLDSSIYITLPGAGDPIPPTPPGM